MGRSRRALRDNPVSFGSFQQIGAAWRLPLLKTSSARVGAGVREVQGLACGRDRYSRTAGDHPGMMGVVLLQLAHLAVTNASAVLGLLSISDRDEDTEISPCVTS